MSKLTDFMESKKNQPVQPTTVTPPVAETKPTPKVENKVETPITSENIHVVASERDAYILERIKSQPKTLEEVKVQSPTFDVEGRHRLSLPKELEKFKAEFAFRWIDKDPRMVSHALDERGWTLVTRQYFSNLPKHLFTASGIIERGTAILAFMPEERAYKLRTEPGKRSMERVKNLPIEKYKDGGEQFYKPSLTEEKDGQQLNSGIQPDAADFGEMPQTEIAKH